MIYYGNPCTESVRDAMSAGRLGCIITPAQGNLTFAEDGWDVIADCGAYSGKWDERKWWAWLLEQPREVRFVVAPDVFYPDGTPCHDETLELWSKWGPAIERHGFTPAFVCQVGSSFENVPDDAPVLFLGGTTSWKLGPMAATIATYHSDRWVHMGRVNSRKRLRYARDIGCKSVDGTYLTFGPDINLARMLRWVDEVNSQPNMSFA